MANCPSTVDITLNQGKHQNHPKTISVCRILIWWLKWAANVSQSLIWKLWCQTPPKLPLWLCVWWPFVTPRHRQIDPESCQECPGSAAETAGLWGPALGVSRQPTHLPVTSLVLKLEKIPWSDCSTENMKNRKIHDDHEMFMIFLGHKPSILWDVTVTVGKTGKPNMWSPYPRGTCFCSGSCLSFSWLIWILASQMSYWIFCSRRAKARNLSLADSQLWSCLVNLRNPLGKIRQKCKKHQCQIPLDVTN